MNIVLLMAAIFCISAVVLVMLRIVYVWIRIRFVLHMVKIHCDPDLCCCGDMRANHGYGTNHRFFSVGDNYLRKELPKWKI